MRPVASSQLLNDLQDSTISIDRLIPPLQNLSNAELQEIAKEPVIPFNIAEDRQYLISIRHGVLVDKNRLMSLLKGDIPSHSNF